MTRMIVGWDPFKDTRSILFVDPDLLASAGGEGEEWRDLVPTVLVVLHCLMCTIALLGFPDICSDFTEAFVWALQTNKLYLNLINLPLDLDSEGKYLLNNIVTKWWTNSAAPVLCHTEDEVVSYCLTSTL
jgi:hypothetical protein